jgi:hypothetical protein
MSTANVDLTTVDSVTRWIASTPSDDEKLNIQNCVTAASLDWVWMCGKQLVDGVSPFVKPVPIDEYYDGPGGTRMFVRNPPISSISSLSVNGVAIAASAVPTSAGYVIDATRKSIALRSGAGVGRNAPRVFCQGIQNVHLVGMAGFDRTPFDIQQAVTQMVAENYKKRQWIGQSSQAMANGAGTVSFRDWAIAPDVAKVIDNYSRNALVY